MADAPPLTDREISAANIDARLRVDTTFEDLEQWLRRALARIERDRGEIARLTAEHDQYRAMLDEILALEGIESPGPEENVASVVHDALEHLRGERDLLRTERDILRTTRGRLEDERKAAHATHWFGAECIAAGCPMPQGIKDPQHDRMYQHRKERVMNDRSAQDNYHRCFTCDAIWPCDHAIHLAEIARLTAEKERLKTRCGELAQQIVDAGALHLADESDITHLRSTCDTLRTERDVLRTTLGNLADERKAARSQLWAAESGSLKMCGNDCLHPECPSWGGAPCPGHARE